MSRRPRACVALIAASCAVIALAVFPSVALAHNDPVPVPDTGCYLGAHTPSGEGRLAEFNANAGKPHAFFGRFVSVGGHGFYGGGPSSVASFAADCYAQGAIPLLTLEPVNATSTALLTPTDVAWLEDFAEDLGGLDRPVYVMFAHEMNGSWYPWGWTNVPSAVYTQGFRDVHEIFAARAPRAAMVWAPNQNWGGTTDDSYLAWYPGDDYVDWVALNTYQWSFSALSPSQFASGILYGDGPESDFYATFAVGHNKPMMIAETGCGDDDPAYYDGSCYGASKDETGVYGTEPGQGAQQWWMRQIYSVNGLDSLAVRFPRIKAVAWFDYAIPGEGDFNIGGSDPASHALGFESYAALIADPHWLSAVPKPVSALAGGSRYDTAIEISRSTFGTGSCDAVILATGRNYPDALGAGSLAGVRDCPILLVDGKATTLATTVRDEIRRLTQGQASFDAYLMGGTLAISQAVENSVRSQLSGATVIRVAGASRYDTAIECARKVRDAAGAPLSDAFVTTGADFADALLAGPVAFAHDRPVLLTDNSAAVTDKLKTALTYCGTIDVAVIGSTSRVTAGTVSALDAHLPGSATRVAGAADPYQQSVDVATWATGAGLLDWNSVGVATGQQYPDALGASSYLGTRGSPLLLTHQLTLDTPVRDCLSAHKTDIWHVTYFGGTLAVAQTVRDAIETALR